MAVDHNNPQSRDEEILIATIDGTEYNKLPQSRIEELLLELKEVIEEGGGGGGTTNYNNLSNQPQVNGETLIGDKSGSDLGLVDAEEGKGLSTNDYDDTEKAAVAAATSAISEMKDGVDIDSFGDVESALSAIKDGSDINSFGDVEVALLDKADVSDLGTAAAKDSTNSVTSGSTDLVESGAVKDAIDAAVAAAYHHAGTKTVAQLTHDLLIAANEGNVYNITDSGTTTSDFIEGIGKQIDAGDNVGICKVGNEYMFDLLSGLEDTSIFVQKSQTAGLLKNDGTVNTTIESTVAGHTTAISAIKDGTDIDSFGDVETALEGKQDTLTFDNVPTDGSTNPVESNGVYDALLGKQAVPTEISYADWQQLTPQQQESGSWLVKRVPGGDLSARVSELESDLSSLMREITTGSILDFALTLPTKKTTFISVGNYVTDTPDGAFYIGAVIRSAISDNQLTIILVRPDNTSVYVHSYYGTWRSSWLKFTTTAVTQ